VLQSVFFMFKKITKIANVHDVCYFWILTNFDQ